MNREQKNAFIQQVQGSLDVAAGFLFVDFTGLTVVEADQLRKKAREAQVSYRVVKNSLLTRALSNTSYATASKCLKGTPTGLVVGSDGDPVSPAKLAFDFAKECEHFKVKGGVVDSQTIGIDEAKALAALPSRAELQAAVVALAKSPGSTLAGQLKSPAGRIVGAVEALAKRLGEGSEEA